MPQSLDTRPIPLSWYFDPAVLAAEQKHLFAVGPQYVGHEQMVPQQGDYRVLPLTGDTKVLVRNSNGVELLSNTCRHRQTLLLKGSGHANRIVCPLHHWTYNTNGALLAAPHFSTKPCLNLENVPLRHFHAWLWRMLGPQVN